MKRTDHNHRFVLKGRRESLLLPAVVRRLAFLALFAGLVGSGAKSAEHPTRPITLSGPGPKFAIADLDGDLRPDLAYVETGRSDVSLTDYWVQLQVTAGQRQAILIVAPTGGLQIMARDVNGDHALDLVLTTAWRQEPVAILLNDGHGGFSQADLTAFPEAFSEPATRWGSSGEQEPAIVGFPPQSRVWGLWAGVRLPRPRSLDEDVPHSDCGFVPSSFLTSYLGRAPPSELPQL